MTYGDHLADQPQVARIDLSFNVGTAPLGGFRLFWYFSATQPSASVLAEWAAHVAAGWGTYMALLQSTNQSLIGVDVVDLTSTKAFQGAWSGNTPGTRTGGELPVDNCVLINYLLHTRYRGGKPRSYLPLGVAPDTTDGRTWLAAFTTQVHTQWNSFTNWINSDTGGVQPANQACVHFYKGPTPNTNQSLSLIHI